MVYLQLARVADNDLWAAVVRRNDTGDTNRLVGVRIECLVALQYMLGIRLPDDSRERCIREGLVEVEVSPFFEVPDLDNLAAYR